MSNPKGDHSTPSDDTVKTKVFDGDQSTSAASHPLTGHRIGEYRIIRQIGEGGMGVVYEAEQQNPHRLVALKVIRGGLHTDSHHVKMFEREIEALARLKHPGIASIYESGRSDDGQMFFAMELVNGVALSDFVEQRRSMSGDASRDINEQLALFAQIGDVVSHAHQRGVIHRDLKPQNVLVTGEADTMSGERFGVKILDFGLARINDPDFRGNTGVSQVGQIKGTLLYMSPEQVRGQSDEIDVRSDVYALGVILYEMLSGQMPYDLSKASLPEAMRIICEEPPKLLSKAWSETHGRSARIDRDVETIALKALEKEPDRRYQSVAAMLEDIERYLNNQPITARPPSAYYQFRKLVARHKAAFASLAVIFLMLLGFGVVMAAQSVRIANERDRALNAEQIAEDRKDEAELARNNEQKQRLIAEKNLDRAESEQKRAQDEKTKAENALKAEAEQRKIADDSLREAKEQTAIAETKKREAELASKQRSLAEDRAVLRQKEAEYQAEANRRQLYISQMNLADQAWEQADTPRMIELLENQIPSAAQVDLRGFEWYHLWRLTHRELLNVKSPGSTMIASLAPNGRSMAITTVDWPSLKTAPTYRTIVRDESGSEVGNFEGRALLGYLWDQRLLTVKNQKLEIVDPTTKEIQPLDLDARVAAPILSRDGRLAATFTKQNTILVTDLTSGRVTRVLDDAFSISRQGGILAHVAPSAAFSHNGRVLAAIAGDSIKVWTLERGGKPELIKVGSDWPMGIAVSPDGTLVASRSVDDRVVKIWGIQTKTLIATYSSENSNARAGSGFKRIEFSPDGKFLAATQGRAVSLWKIPDGRLVDEIKGHGDTVTTLSFSSDSKALLTGGTDEVKLWPLPLDDPFPSAALKLFFGTMSANGKLLAITEMDGSIELWDPETMLHIGELRGKDRQRGVFPLFPRFSPDGKILLVLQYQVPFVHPDDAGKILSTGMSMLGVAEIWDTTSRVKLGTLPGQMLLISDFSPDGKVVAAQEFDPKDGSRSLVLWDLSTQKSIYKFPNGHSAAFSPNGELLAISTRDNIKLLDTGTKIALDPGPDLKTRSASLAVTFSPNSDLIAYADEKKVMIWDLKTRKSFGILKGHSSGIRHLTFTPDGKRIASVDESGAVKLWDVSTCSLLSTPMDEGIPQPVVFAPDGRSMITGGKYGLRILRAATDADVAKQRGK